MKKRDLILKVISEFRRAQVAPWNPPPAGKVRGLALPPMLPLPSGSNLAATDELLEAVRAYARIWLQNNSSFRVRIKFSELDNLSARAFGASFAEIDLKSSDDEIADALQSGVAELISNLCQETTRNTIITLGCQVFKSDRAYPIKVGPVIFEDREDWLVRAAGEGRISLVTARRLSKVWSGVRVRKRKASYDSIIEDSILQSVATCPVVCSVTCRGLSPKMRDEKGFIAARAALAGLSLMWTQPSQGLSWMNLLYDGRSFHRNFLVFGELRGVGTSSSLSQMPEGRWTDDEFISQIKSYQWLFDAVGKVIHSYIQPTEAASSRLSNALFLSLFWMYQACREASDQVATTKFVASMDALAGGRGANGIRELIEARLGPGPSDQFMKDGRRVKDVVDHLYEARRSRMIHGSSDDFAHDWSEVRSSAEVVGRLCLVSAFSWLVDNPDGTDVKSLSLK